MSTSVLEMLTFLEVIRRLSEAGFSGGKNHIGWGFVQVNEAAKHFSRSQMETVQRGRKLSVWSPWCTWGQERGETGMEEFFWGGLTQLAGAELSREFICSHGNPQSSREKNVGILIKTCPRACVLVPKITSSF